MGPIHFDTNYERLLSSKTCEWIESLGPIANGAFRVRPLADFEIGVVYVCSIEWTEHRIKIPEAIKIFSEPKNFASIDTFYKVLGQAEEAGFQRDKALLRRVVKLAEAPARGLQGSIASRGLLGEIALLATVSLARFYGTRGPLPEGKLACYLRDQTIVLRAGITMLERLSRSLPERYTPSLHAWKSELAKIQTARSLQRGARRMQVRERAALQGIHSLRVAA